MKKIILLLSMTLCVALLGFGLVGCSEDLDNLTLDSEGFDPVVEYGRAVDFGSLYLVYGEGEDQVRIPVTDDMIDGDFSTDTVGRKNILIRYEGRLLRFSFDVKYCATFMAGDTVIEKVYVGEGEAPVPPSPDGHAPLGMEFAGWTPTVPTELTDNATFAAQYAPSTEVPTLQDLSASYGQTLGDLALPSSAVGAWVFVDAPETSVGELGAHSFAVRFMPSDPLAQPIDGEVTVNVGKATISFGDLVDSFVYDGTEKFPTYTVPEGITVIALGERATNVGRYDFTLLIDDENYEGTYTGSYTVTKATATVELPDYSLTFDEAKTFVPVTYTVSGLDEALLGKVTVLKPPITGGGSYRLSAMIENAANIDITVSGGALTVSKSSLVLTPPTLASGVVAYYGDPLSSLALSAHGNGVWSWKDASLVIDKAGSFTATAVFTPTNTGGYEATEMSVTFSVAKKVLPITINVGSPVYNGEAHEAAVTIADGEYDSLGLTVNILYNGLAEAPINAGVYTVTAELADERYEGRATAQMNIAKATPTGVDFSLLFDELIWSENGHTLSEIALPAGYSWVNASTAIPDSNIGVFIAYPAIFTPADTENYAVVNGEFKLLLNRAPAGIVGSAQQEFIYNAASHTLLGLYNGSHGESELEFYDESGNRFDFATLKNVGTYKIVVVLPESAHYEKAERTVTVTVLSGEFPGKTAPTGLAGIFTYKLSTVILPSDPDGKWVWVEPDTSLEYGNQTYTAKFIPNDTGYNEFTAGVKLWVGPKPIPVPTDTYEKLYTGQKQTAGALPGEGYLPIDNGETDAGLHKITYTLTDTQRYTWEDGTTAPKEVYCYTITKADNGFTTAPTLNKYEWKYDEDPATPNSYATSFGVPKMSLNGNEITAIPAGLTVGSYTLVFTVAGTANYAGIETSLTFTVTKGEVEIPTLAGKVYNGQPQSASLPGSATLYKIKENVSAVNAGTYTVTLTLDDPENYEWKNHEGADVSVSFSIDKAPNNWNVVPTLSKTEWTYGQAVASLNAYAAKFGTAALTLNDEVIEELPATFAAGSYTLVVSVADTADFAGLTQTFSFTVNKAEVEIPTLGSKEYTGEVQGATIPDGTLYTIKTNVSGKDAGTYEKAVTLTLTDPDNYVWKNHEGADVSVDFVITKAENAWTEAPSVPGIIFGGTLSPIGTPKFGTVTVEYKRYGTADPYTATKPTAQGTYYARFTVEETDNYKGLVAENLRFSIAEATNAWVNEPTVDKTAWTYGEKTITVLNGGKADFGNVVIILDDKVVTEIPAVLDAGTHTLIFRVEGTADYTNLTKTFTLTVSPKKITAPTEGFKATYNGEAQTAGATPGEGYTVVDNGGENAGTYKVYYKLESANYIWSDGMTTDKSVDFVIAPKKISVPTATYEKTYTGSLQTAGAEAGEGYTVEDLGGTDVKTYPVVYKLESANYVWADGTNTDKSVECFTIKQAENAWTTAPVLNKDEWKYDEEAATLNSFAASFGVAKIFFNGNEITAIPTGLAVGNYSVTVSIEETANYKALTETLSFTINPAIVDVSVLPTTPFGATYNGETQTAGAVAGTGYTVTDLGGKNAGTYEVIYKLASANYIWSDGTTADKSVDFVIAPKKISVPTATYEKTYNGDVQKAGAAAGEGYTVVDNGGENAGTYDVIYKLKNDNFVWADGSTDDKSVECFTIKKIVVELPDNATTVYTGSAQSSSFGVDGVYTAANVEKRDVGNYSVTLTLVDPANYEWENSKTSETATVTFSITKADNAWITAPAVPDIIYDEELVVIGAPNFGGETLLVDFREATADDVDSAYSTEKPTEKGSYVARFRVADTANYAGLTAFASFSISTANNVWTTEPSLDKTEWTYGEKTATVLNGGKADFGDVVIILDDKVVTEIPAILDAGTHTLTFRVEGTNDYTTLTKTFTLTVFKKAVTAPTEGFKATYNGEVQTAGAEAGEGYTVEDLGGTDAKTYPVVYKLKANYIWSDGSTDDKTVNFVILPKKVTAPTESFESTYNGAVQTAGAEAGEGYTVVDNDGENARTYKVYYKLKANYVWSDGSTDDKTVNFVILPKKVTAPTEGFKATYNGEAQTAGAEAGEGYTVEDLGGTNAGTYTVTYKLAANYVWADGTNTDKSVDFVIAKAEVEIPTLGSKPYNGKAQGATLPDETGLYTITQNVSEVNVGTYSVTLTLTDTKNYVWKNHEETDVSVDFVIEKAKASVSELTVEDWSFDGEASAPAFTLSPFYDGTVSYLYSGTTATGFPYEDDEAPLVAGSYTLTVSIAATANCDIAEGGDAAEYSFRVLPKKVNKPTATVETVVYDDKNHKPDLSGLATGCVAVANDGRTNAGGYSVEFKLESANYVWSDGTTENVFVQYYEIVKADNAWTTEPILSQNSWKYGSPASLSYAAKLGTVTLMLDGKMVEAIASDIPVGDHTLVVSVEGTENYTGLTATITFAVEQAIVDISVVPTTPFGTTYNENAQTAGATPGEGYTVEDLGGTEAGTYPVIYKLVSDNYIWSDGTTADKSVDFVIAPITVTLPEESFTTVYNGAVQTAGAVAGEGYTVEDLGGKNAGTYAVTYKLVSGNYIWNDGTTADKSVTCFTITKAENAWTTEPSLSKNSWKYGEEVAALTYASQYGPVTLTLNGEAIEALPALLKADDYVLVVSVTDTDNYAGLSETLSFTVEKAELEVPSFSSPYSGQSQEAILPEGVTDYEIKKNESKTNVGTYDIVLTLTNENYAWKGIEGKDATAKFSITTFTENDWSVAPTLSKTEWKYGETPATLNAFAALFGDAKITLNGNEITAIPEGLDVGDYELVFTVADTANYNGFSDKVGFKITPIELDIPSFSAFYTGSPQGATLPVGTTLYTITQNVSEEDAGEYNITVTLQKSNYAWKNLSGKDATAKFTIKQTENEWKQPLPSIPNVAFGETPSPIATPLYGEVNADIEYKVKGADDSTYTTELPSALGEYTARLTVDETPNYKKLTATCDFSVTKNTANTWKVEPTLSKTEWKYGEAPAALNAYAALCGTATMTLNGKVITAIPTGLSVGTYTLVFTVEDNAAYNGFSGSVDFEIKPASPTVLFPEYKDSAVYQNNLSFEGIATGVDGASLTGSFTTNLPTLSSTTPYFTPGPEATKSFTYTVTFTPDDSNYSSVSKEITVTLKAAAYIGSTYYGSIEDALYHAVSGNEVWVVLDASDSILSGNIIKSNCTIKSGVTLVLPYEKDGAAAINAKDQATLNGATLYNGDMLYVDTNADRAYTAGTDSYLHITNTVTVAAGVRITNLGTLKIGGELSGAAGGSIYAGHTAGSAAQLILSRGAVIESSGTIKAYGFIEEDVKDNGSKVVITAGRIDIPFVLRDFRGGSIMGASALVEGGENYVSVFNRFIFNNVMPTLEVGYSGNVYGIANLYATRQNSTTAHIVGNASSAVLQMSANGKLIAKYNKFTEVTKLDLYGGATTNGMEISAAGTEVNTAEYAFSLSYHWDISLKKVAGAPNEYTMGQLFKLMPGARIVVEEGVTLNVTNMNIYGADFKDPCGTRPYPHNGTDNINEVTKEALDGGMLLIYGHLNATNIGGTIHLGAGGTVNDLTGVSCTTKDIREGGRGEGLSALTFWANFETLTQPAKLAGYGTVVSFDPVGGIPEKDFAVVYEGKVTLPSATKDGYAFLGWYTASEGGERIGGAGDEYTSEVSVTLYAQWERVNQAAIVTLDKTTGSCSTPNLVADENGNVTLPEASKTGHAFLGWYTAATGGTHVGGAGDSYTPEGDITLYAQFRGYVVTFNANGGTCGTSSLTADANGKVTLPEATNGSKTFDGWFVNKSGGTSVGGKGATYTPEGDVTLYAHYSSSCVTGDTLVTLADGSKKELSQLKVDDDILVFDFYSGEFTVVKAGYIINHGYAENTVITLYFDDGTEVRVVNVHGFFDVATNEFVFIREDNVAELLGHEFAKLGEDGSVTTVRLIDYSVSVECIEAWSVLSFGMYNCLLNGMLTITPPEYGGNIYMPFEIGEDMKIDEEKMQADIEKYGLCTYEEWSDRMPRELFDALGMKYFKISLGKGIITEEQADMLLALHFGI